MANGNIIILFELVFFGFLFLSMVSVMGVTIITVIVLGMRDRRRRERVRRLEQMIAFVDISTMPGTSSTSTKSSGSNNNSYDLNERSSKAVMNNETGSSDELVIQEFPETFQPVDSSFYYSAPTTTTKGMGKKKKRRNSILRSLKSQREDENDSDMWNQLPICPCLHILQYLVLIVPPAPRLHFSSRNTIERVLMRHMFGAFVRNNNDERLIYLVFPHIDLTQFNSRALTQVPHCLRLADVKSIWCERYVWSLKDDIVRHNAKLTHVSNIQFPLPKLKQEKKKMLGIKRKLQSEETEEDNTLLVPVLNNIRDIGIVDCYMDIVFPRLRNVERLTTNQLHLRNQNALDESCQHLQSLKHLRLGMVTEVILSSIMSNARNLTSIYISTLRYHCQLSKHAWTNAHKLESFIIYRSENCTVYLPLLCHPSLKSVYLGLGVTLDPQSIEPDHTISYPDSSENGDNHLMSLSIVEPVPYEFFQASRLRQIGQKLQRLSLTIPVTAIPLLSSTIFSWSLFPLKILQLRCCKSTDMSQFGREKDSSGHSMEITVRDALANGSTMEAMPHLEFVLLNNLSLYQKVRIVVSNNEEDQHILPYQMNSSQQQQLQYQEGYIWTTTKLETKALQYDEALGEPRYSLNNRS